MSIESFRSLAALIAAHPGGKIVGRTRLQKEVKLLQRLDYPTDYSYTIHFYGPYSEELQSDVGLLEAFSFVEETQEVSAEGNPYYVLRSKSTESLPDVQKFQPLVQVLDASPTVVLELAATYDAFRETGATHSEALERLRRKKGGKCDGGNEDAALRLLQSLGLPTT